MSIFTMAMQIIGILLVIGLFCNKSNAQLVGISGSIASCDKEGEVIPLPGIINDPCYSCTCKNDQVQCEKQSCTNLDGCFLVVWGLKKGCCDVCKGCTVGNTSYAHGELIPSDNPCSNQKCLAGIITRTSVECHVPCSHPNPPSPGQCCPSCNSCYVNGKLYKDGEESILNGDPCTRCTCKYGNLSCTKSACPVLSCPPSSTYLPQGECCPRCNGTRTRYIPRTVCILGDKVYPTKTTFRLDTCTNCTCEGTTATCDRVTCPPLLDCHQKEQVMTHGNCCPTCKQDKQVTLTTTSDNSIPISTCTWNGKSYVNGDKWDVDECQSCVCDWGRSRCTQQLCPKDTTCPWGFVLKKKSGTCCAQCVGQEGTCTVFGDPHYRSFDGRVFNFQGACKYLLTADCKGKSFSVRVRNDARTSSSFSWTRTVTLKTKEGRLTLGQKMRLKFNGKRIALPFIQGGLKVTKEEGGYAALVETSAGVRLLWDGDSFLELTVPYKMHGRLCGLCGNFNGNRTDDFVTRRGNAVQTPNSFGVSWRVGGKKACSRPEQVTFEPLCKKNNWVIRERAEKLCNALKSTIFTQCARKVTADRFIKACKVDMCECPSDRKCHCDALMAYSRACALAGVPVPNWRESTRCTHRKFWKT